MVRRPGWLAAGVLFVASGISGILWAVVVPKSPSVGLEGLLFMVFAFLGKLLVLVGGGILLLATVRFRLPRWLYVGAGAYLWATLALLLFYLLDFLRHGDVGSPVTWLEYFSFTMMWPLLLFVGAPPSHTPLVLVTGALAGALIGARSWRNQDPA